MPRGQNVECKYGTKKRFPFLSQGAFVLTLAIRPPQQHVIALSSQSRRTQQNIGHRFPGGPQALGSSNDEFDTDHHPEIQASNPPERRQRTLVRKTKAAFCHHERTCALLTSRRPKHKL